MFTRIEELSAGMGALSGNTVDGNDDMHGAHANGPQILPWFSSCYRGDCHWCSFGNKPVHQNFIRYMETLR